VAREVENVHAEYCRNTNSDARKLLQLRRSLGVAPYSNFSTGSLATLRDAPGAAGVDVGAVLRRLWDMHYAAPATTVAVVGPQEPAKLLRWVEDAFGEMRRCGNATSTTTAACSASSTGTTAAATSGKLDGTQRAAGDGDCCTDSCSGSASHASNSGSAVLRNPVCSSASSRDHVVTALERYPTEVMMPPDGGSRLLLVCPERDLRDLELSYYVRCGLSSHAW
jgi:hypothetical protein